MEVILTLAVFGFGMPVVAWFLNRDGSKVSKICVHGPKKVTSTTYHYAAPGYGHRQTKVVAKVY
jgi:hypothetical protein